MFWIVLLVTFLGTSTAAAEEIDFLDFQKILDTKCGKCHTRTRIDQAIAEGKAFQAIGERMGKHGAELSDRERDVMGVFWVDNSQDVKKMTPTPVKDDPLGEYRSVLQARCTGCHALDRIEQAVSENRSFEALAKMMLDRGAVLTEADHKVLGTFWGEPLR